MRDSLREQLEQVVEQGDEALQRGLSYLREMQAFAWSAVARGDLDAPGAVLDCLRPLRALAARPQLPAASQLGSELNAALWTLYVAHEALRRLRTEARLSDDRRSATEREVLRVLATANGEYLRRRQVHIALRLEPRPTPARIGQVLSELHDEGLLLRVHVTAQGNPETAFYQLSAAGQLLAQQLRIESTGDPAEADLSQLVELAGSSFTPAEERRMMLGWLARESRRKGGAYLAQAALARYHLRRGTVHEATARDVYVTVLRSLLMRLVIEPADDGSFQLKAQELPPQLLDGAADEYSLLEKCLESGALAFGPSSPGTIRGEAWTPPR